MSSEENKYVVTQEEFTAPTKGQKLRRHCAKWWWVHLIILIIVVLVVILPVILVGIPNIAQQRVNKAKLTVQGISATDTTANSFTLGINATIHADNSIHAVIDPFVGEMYLEDVEPHTPFITVDFPQITSDSESTLNISQSRNITNLAAFTDFNAWLLTNDSVRVTVKGKSKIKVSGVSRKYDVNFKKTVTLDGIRNFNGSTVNHAALSLLGDASGNNFNGFLAVPNPSVVRFDIGNVTWDTYLLGSYVGVSHLLDVDLQPGNAANNYTLHANISESAVLETVMKKPYCDTGILPFDFQGKQVVKDGQNLTYYSGALASKNQTVYIDIGSILRSSLNLNVSCSSSDSTR